MKKLLTILCAASISFAAAFAQENGNRSSDGKVVRGPYETNPAFFDNFFIEVQGGINYTFGQYMREGRKMPYRPAFAGAVNIGKWFSPVLGLRLGWQGVVQRWFDSGIDYFENSVYNYPHADFLVNVSNWWSGYKETRFWDVSPYISAGWVFADRRVPTSVSSNSFGMGLGIYNTLRLAPRWHLTLDLRSIVTDRIVLGPDYIDLPGAGEKYSNKLCCMASALVGISFTLGKTAWKRPSGDNAGAAAQEDARLAAAAMAAVPVAAAVAAAADEAPAAAEAPASAAADETPATAPVPAAAVAATCADAPAATAADVASVAAPAAETLAFAATAAAADVAADEASAAAEAPVAVTAVVPVSAVQEAAKTEGIEVIGYFTIGKSVFNESQLAAWKKSAKGLDKSLDYVVTGYSDKETGTEERNAVLRRERAEYVKKLMIEEGFTGKIENKAADQNERLVKTPGWKNRAAVIR